MAMLQAVDQFLAPHWAASDPSSLRAEIGVTGRITLRQIRQKFASDSVLLRLGKPCVR